MKLIDKYNRVHNYLRLSITDKCNLNCVYCNPTKNAMIITHVRKLMTDEEIERIINLFLSKFEFKKIRLTGGEPFARKNIVSLIEKIGKLKQNFDFEVNATTNGTLLNEKLHTLINLGLDRLNFSIDSLKNDTFREITRFDKAEKTIKVILKAKEIGLKNIKLNTVVMKGINDNEINDFVDFAVQNDLCVRFIEYMPFTNNDYNKNHLMTMSEIIAIIKEKHELIELNNNNSSVAKEYRIKNKLGKVSIISSISKHFCSNCNRLRITSTGQLRLCLFSPNNNNLDLRKMIVQGYSDNEIAEQIVNSLEFKNQSHADLGDLIMLDSNNMIHIGG